MFLMPGSRARAGGTANYNLIPRGTVMMFIQAAAPRFWTRVTTNDDALLRIVGSATPSTGGTNGFVATVNSQTGTGTGTTGTGTSGATTLTTGQIPAHSHSYQLQYALGNGVASFNGSAITGNSVNGGTSAYAAIGSQSTNTDGGSGGSHTHTVPGLSVPSLSVTFGIKYVDSLVASKN